MTYNQNPEKQNPIDQQVENTPANKEKDVETNTANIPHTTKEQAIEGTSEIINNIQQETQEQKEKQQEINQKETKRINESTDELIPDIENALEDNPLTQEKISNMFKNEIANGELSTINESTKDEILKLIVQIPIINKDNYQNNNVKNKVEEILNKIRSIIIPTKP
jgi:hypothetical protein